MEPVGLRGLCALKIAMTLIFQVQEDTCQAFKGLSGMAVVL